MILFAGLKFNDKIRGGDETLEDHGRFPVLQLPDSVRLDGVVMWPFSKKQPVVEKEEAPAWKHGVEQFKAFRDIGEKFNYLGVEMICTAHKYTHYSVYEMWTMPQLEADYVDKNGKLQNAAWPLSELPCLLAENEAT